MKYLLCLSLVMLGGCAVDVLDQEDQPATGQTQELLDSTGSCYVFDATINSTPGYEDPNTNYDSIRTRSVALAAAHTDMPASVNWYVCGDADPRSNSKGSYCLHSPDNIFYPVLWARKSAVNSACVNGSHKTTWTVYSCAGTHNGATCFHWLASNPTMDIPPYFTKYAEVISTVQGCDTSPGSAGRDTVPGSRTWAGFPGWSSAGARFTTVIREWNALCHCQYPGMVGNAC